MALTAEKNLGMMFPNVGHIIPAKSNVVDTYYKGALVNYREIAFAEEVRCWLHLVDNEDVSLLGGAVVRMKDETCSEGEAMGEHRANDGLEDFFVIRPDRGTMLDEGRNAPNLGSELVSQT